MVPNEINVIDNNGLLTLYLHKIATEGSAIENIILSHDFLLKWLEKDGKKDRRIHDVTLEPLIEALEKIFQSSYPNIDTKGRKTLWIRYVKPKNIHRHREHEISKVPELSQMRKDLGFSSYLKSEY